MKDHRGGGGKLKMAKNTKKPRGWFHRYEIILRPVKFHPDRPARDEWCIVQYFGRNKGAGVKHMGTGNPNLTDEYLIRRSGCDSVTVPVYVVRNGIPSEPYFSKFYGQK